MELRDATKAVQASGDPARLLRFADQYMVMRLKIQGPLQLPEQHQILRPIVETFAGHLDKYREYVKGLWDNAVYRYGADSGIASDLYEFSRTLDIRYAQQLRRERIQRAADWLRATRPDLPAPDRHVWVKRLEQEWAAQRLEQLREAKAKKGDRLTEDERRHVLDAFWAGLDAQLEQDQLPSYEDLCPGATQP